MGKTEWMPSREQDLFDLCIRWANVLSVPENVTACGWDMQECSDVQKCIDEFTAARADYSASDSTANMFRKNTAKKAVINIMRSFANSSVRYNRRVDDNMRLSLGIRPHDIVRTPAGDPVGQAEADISYPARTQLMLQIRHVNGTPSDTKANYGYRIYFGIFAAGQTLPSSGKDLRESRFTRQKRELFTFEQSDTGKTACFCIRYENSRGKSGAWGPLFSALIP